MARRILIEQRVEEEQPTARWELWHQRDFAEPARRIVVSVKPSEHRLPLSAFI